MNDSAQKSLLKNQIYEICTNLKDLRDKIEDFKSLLNETLLIDGNIAEHEMLERIERDIDLLINENYETIIPEISKKI